MSVAQLFPTFSLPTFTLPGLLPLSTCVVLDVRTCTAILLHLDASSSRPFVGACQLKPSAARIFLALLQTYPLYCTHQQLFAMLYSDQSGKGQAVWEPISGLKAVRRALFALSSALRFMGLEAVALRGHGYVLAAASPDIKAAEAGMLTSTAQEDASYSLDASTHGRTRFHEREMI